MVKRKYSGEYLKFGFVCMPKNGLDLPQCINCFRVLSNDSMKPSKLELHLTKCHPELRGKDINYFQRMATALKKQKLDGTGSYQTQNERALEASYRVAYLVAQKQKPHTIAENLILPAAKEMVRLVIGEDASKKLNQIPLSNNTIQRRVEDISNDLKQQIVEEVKTSPSFAIQLDESTDIASCSQLMVFVRYCYNERIKEEFLFCKPLKTTTTATDIMEMVSLFFDEFNFDWKNLVGITTDGAPAMLGSRAGFHALVKIRAPNSTGIHCFIHREALATKSLPNGLNVIFKKIISVVNYVKGSALNVRLFKTLCEDFESDHSILLYYTAVRWLSAGAFLARFFELREEVEQFLQVKGKNELLNVFAIEHFHERLAYIVDILEILNQLNLKLQGKGGNVLSHTDHIEAFLGKLELYRKRVEQGNLIMFPRLKQVRSEQHLPDIVLQEIIYHITQLEDEFRKYFPMDKSNYHLARNPFTCQVSDVPEEAQEEFIELINDSTVKDAYQEKTLEDFWCHMMKSYPIVTRISLHAILPFSTTYLCESAFSSLLALKTKQRNRLLIEDDLRCTLADRVPRFDVLIRNMQAHPSH
jgi:hypothetical protein